MAVNLNRSKEVGLRLPVFCFICNSSFSVTNGYSTYFTSVANGKILLADSIKKLSDLKYESEVLQSSFLCRRCFSLFDELELTNIKCNELQKTILDFYTNKTAKDEVEEHCNFLSLDSQESDFCCSPQPDVDNVEDKQDAVQDQALPNEQMQHVGLQCELCDRFFRRSCNLQSHMRVHSKQNAKLDKLPVDVELVSSEERKPFVGDEEPHTYSTVALDGNAEIRSNITEENDSQYILNLKDLESSEMDEGPKPRKKRHTEDTAVQEKDHIKRALHECKTCGKKWQRARQLKIHEATHSQLRPFICEICGQAYKRKHALDVHVGMHKGINPFSCHVCGKVFTQKAALQRHTPLHTGEAPYQCEVCGKRFVHHTSFNLHKLAHSGAKMYKCEVCGLNLISGSHLKRHSRIHTGERPFACPHCNRKFAENYNLVTHLRTHKVEREANKLHSCSSCGLNFVHKSKLEDHLTVCRNKTVDVPKNQWMTDLFSQDDLESGSTETEPPSFAWSASFMKPTSSILHLDY